MRPLARGAVIAVAQVALIASVAGKLLYDRQTLPRAWVQTAGVDPELPIRGRYVALNLLFEVAPESETIPPDETLASGRLLVRADRAQVVLHRAPSAAPQKRTLQFSRRDTPEGPRWMLTEPVAYFLSEDAPDPTRDVAPGGLWMEVTVPPRSAPRPIRLRASSP